LLSGHATARFLARPELVLAVLTLATVGFVAGNFPPEPRVIGQPGTKPSERSVPAQHSFWAKWRQPYEKDLVGSLLVPHDFAFTVPLFDSAITVTPRVLHYMPYFDDVHKGAPAGSEFIALCGFFAVTAAVFLPVLVCLLGWIRDAQHPLRISACPRYLRESYWPMAKGMLIFFGVAVGSLLVGAVLAAAVAALARLGGRAINENNLGLILAYLGILLLTLAPFAVVGRRFGTRQGIAEGWRLLRANWPAMVVLFLVLRLALEAVAIWTLLAPWPLTKQTGSLIVAPGAVAWSWAARMGEAMLGLWLAYAYMEMATEPPAADA
jgi:hypothetical protein